MRAHTRTHAFRKIKMKDSRGERLISGPVKPRRRGPGGACTYHAITHTGRNECRRFSSSCLTRPAM